SFQGALDQHLAVVAGGSVPTIAAIRSLDSLPQTKEEIQQVGANLDALPDSAHLEADDTETALKKLDRLGVLHNARVVMISTHGLLGGSDPNGNPISPGLVFTPPAQATSADDGYLTTEEAAALNLNADLVILSACNTASGTGAGRPLSGLA